MNQKNPQFGKPKQAGLPVMIFVSIFGHALAMLVFLIAPGLLSSSNPEPFGGSPGGNVMWVSSAAIGTEGKPSQKELTQEEPAPAQFLKKATAEEEDVPLPSKTEFPEPEKKKPKEQPAAKETLNQAKRKIEGPYGKGTDKSENSGKSGTDGKGKTGLGIGIGGTGDGSGTGTGTGVPFPYPWYIDIVKTKIELNWRKPFLEQAGQEFSATVYFVIQRNGQVKMVKTEQLSGIPSLDRSCESAILGAAPFPPLPTQWTEPDLAFRLTFRYTQ